MCEVKQVHKDFSAVAARHTKTRRAGPKEDLLKIKNRLCFLHLSLEKDARGVREVISSYIFAWDLISSLYIFYKKNPLPYFLTPYLSLLLS